MMNILFHRDKLMNKTLKPFENMQIMINYTQIL